jgi:hypothetical protein
MKRVLLILLVPLLAAACRDDRWPTGPGTGAALALDRAHAGGTRGVSFLPPLGSDAGRHGAFDGSLSPVVRICEWNGASCAREIVEFTTAGRGSQRVRVDPREEHYIVNWHTDGTELAIGPLYRIRVLVEGTELGSADVSLYRTGGEARGAPPGVHGMVRGSTLPIKFRIETEPGDRLPGNPSDPAGPAIPDREFEPRAEDYSDTHPRLRGIFLSFNTLLLAFDSETPVGEANAVLEQIDARIIGGIPGVADVPGILFLRVPTRSHEQMIALLAQLRQDPRVRQVVQDVLLGEDAIPRPNGGVPATWTWEVRPTGGNWGLELLRVPQMWGLNAAVHKLGGTPPLTGVLDTGFARNHPDLHFFSNRTPALEGDHGTHVAGIIGATFDNGVGVDGVNPFALLVVQGLRITELAGPGGWFPQYANSGAQIIQGYLKLVLETPDVKVVNSSLGYNWSDAGINADLVADAQHVANAQGALVTIVQALLTASTSPAGTLPVWLTSAGNDGGRNARWNSPMSNAALAWANANIVVVESLKNSPGSPGGATLTPSSNLGGHLSAPGEDILSTVGPPATYDLMTGTSMAAPHVAGLVGYLYTLDPSLPRPTLVTNPVYDLLSTYSVPLHGGARNRIDAFSTSLGVDSLQGNTRVLRMLLDIDDGTPDGNQRARIPGSTAAADDYTGEDADGDGGIGDGRIDMADFRRWRDWLLAVEQAPGLQLDGSARHPKKDINGNGRFQSGDNDNENLYPRGDFNGDGHLSRLARHPVPGHLRGAELTDLEVLKALFQDPHYTAFQLVDLIDSGDLEIDASGCFARAGAVTVRTSLTPRGGGGTSHVRPHSRDAPVEVITVAFSPEPYTARTESLNDGRVIGLSEQEFHLPLGGDRYWKPTCGVPPPPPPTGDVVGRVVDGVRGYRLEGVQIDFDNEGGRAYTNPEGNFFKTLNAGEYRASVGKRGYRGAGFRVIVSAGGTTDVGEVELMPLPDGTLTGRVLDAATGLPLSGVNVYVADLEWDPRDEGLVAGTGQDGRFSAELMTGRYGVRLTRAGYETHAISPVTVQADQATDLGNVPLVPMTP